MKSMRFFLGGYFFLLPFQWALSLAEGVDLALIRLVTIGGLFFWLSLSLVHKQLKFPSGFVVFPFSSFLFLTVLSLFWAENMSFALRKIAFLLSFAPLFFLLCSWLNTSVEHQRFLVKAYVAGSFLLALCSIGIFLSQFIFGLESVYAFLVDTLLPFFLGETFAASVAAHPSLLVNISGATVLRASGIFPDPHMFAYYVGMATPFASALAFLQKSERRFWLVAGCFLLLADLLSFSRGGYVGLLGALVVVLLAKSQYFLTRVRSALIVAMLVILAFVLLSQTPFGTRFTSVFSGTDGSNNERLRLWREAVVHIEERPFFGVGIGNYPLLVKPGASYREPFYAHNLYLDIALEIGIVGLAFFLSVFVGIFFRITRLYQSAPGPMELALLASLALFLCHSFFETPLFSVHVLPVLLLLISLGVSYRHTEP